MRNSRSTSSRSGPPFGFGISSPFICHTTITLGSSALCSGSPRRISAKSPPAYAVLDLRLEDGSGLSVVEALNKHRPDARVDAAHHAGDDVGPAVAVGGRAADDDDWQIGMLAARPVTYADEMLRDSLHAPLAEFLDADRRWIVCSIHGASYAPRDGRCAGGPCGRGKLTSLKVIEREGEVYWYPSRDTRPVSSAQSSA